MAMAMGRAILFRKGQNAFLKDPKEHVLGLAVKTLTGRSC